ncbi:MAG: NUDIX hydrolase [Planctomycetaceae bacterium]
MTPLVLASGKFLRLVDDAGWEYVERTRGCGVVAVVAVTPDHRLILTEQYRPAVGRPVIDLPAGLAGDAAGEESEAFADAARRELIEETGHDAAEMVRLLECTTSPGLTSETVTLFRAVGMRRTGDGGGDGDGDENITVHAVPLDTAADWLNQRAAEGALIDMKVYAGLWFAR